MTATSNASLFLSPRVSPQARMRLFCFPNAGGGVATLYSWLRGLPQQIQLCPIQLPGRENRRQEPPYTRIEPLVATLLNVLQPYTDLPFAFYGHSLGSLVAFELARALRARGLPGPFHLIVSARSGPQIAMPGPTISHLPEPQFIAEISARYKAIPAQVLGDRDLMELIMPALRADMEMVETYRFIAGDPLDCPVSALGGADDLLVSPPDLDSWRHHTTAAFAMRMFPGDHFFPRSGQAEFTGVISQILLNSLR
jgi:surfactin synthase thioesterase subunit